MARLRSMTRSEHGTTHLGDDWEALVKFHGIDVIAECTGNPVAAVEHCLAAFSARKPIINVTVEADAFCGPILAHKAKQAGVIYSLAYGDQPALACDLVDWARACGFPVVAAGRGHKWLPKVPEIDARNGVGSLGPTAEQAARGGMNPKMFNAFLDGSKPAIELAAIANATGLEAPSQGLAFPPGSVDDIPTLMRPRAEGRRPRSQGAGRGGVLPHGRRQARSRTTSEKASGSASKATASTSGIVSRSTMSLRIRLAVTSVPTRNGT